MATEQPGNGPAPSVEERMSNLFAADAGEAQPEVAADASASDDQVVQTEETEQPSEEGSDEQEEPKEASLAIEIDGQKYTHDELKSAVHGYKDYTRKTQEVADMRRHVDSTLQMQAIQQQLAQVTSEEQKQLQQVQAQIEQYRNVDWTTLDTDTIVRARTTLDGLKDKAQELEKAISGKQDQAKRAIGQAMQQQVTAAFDFIRKHVPDLSPGSQKLSEVARYAENYGLPNETFSSLGAHVPALAVFAAKAMAFDALQASKSAAVAKVKAAPPVLKPGASANQNTAAQLKYKEARSRLKKSGDLKDAAALFMGLK